MSAKTVIQLKQLAAIAVAWVLVAIVMSVYDYLVLNTMYSQGPSSVYTFQKALLLNVVSAIVGASLGGSLLVFYVNVKFIDKPFIQTVIAVTFGYGIVIVVIICVITYLSVSPAIEQSISYSDIWTAIQKKSFIRRSQDQEYNDMVLYCGSNADFTSGK
jgi:adenylate cyclase